jgi:hypothetical protein
MSLPGTALWRSSFTLSVIALLAAVLWLGPGAPLPAGGAPKAKHHGQHLKQLQIRFAEWDSNGDNVLDKTELAKVFRGAQAKPYDQLTKLVSPATPAVKKTDRPVKLSAVVLVSFPCSGMTVQLAAAQMVTDNPSAPAPETKAAPPTPVGPDPNTLPDVQFMALVGKKNDGTVTKADFDAWAKQTGTLLDRRDDLQQEVKQSEGKVQRAANAKARMQAQQELQRHAQDLSVVNTQLGAIPPAIRQALKIH